MTVLRDGVDRLARQTEREVTALFRRFDRGAIDRDQFVALAAAVIARARARGVALADLSLTAQIVRSLREPVPPLGLLAPDGDSERLQRSVASVLSEEVDFDGPQLARSRSDRLARLGRDGAAEAAVWGMRLAMIERGVRGWIRVTDLDPCRVCSNLADGVVRPPSVVMKRHTGCACVQSAVI